MRSHIITGVLCALIGVGATNVYSAYKTIRLFEVWEDNGKVKATVSYDGGRAINVPIEEVYREVKKTCPMLTFPNPPGK